MRDQQRQASELREAIARLLSEQGELPAGEIAKRLGCRAPSLSYHLDHMLRIGVVAVEPRGSLRIYRLATTAREAAPPAPPPIRVFFVKTWTGRVPEADPDLAATGPDELLAQVAKVPGISPAHAALVRSVARALEGLDLVRTATDAVVQLDAGVFKLLPRGR